MWAMHTPHKLFNCSWTFGCNIRSTFSSKRTPYRCCWLWACTICRLYQCKSTPPVIKVVNPQKQKGIKIVVYSLLPCHRIVFDKIPVKRRLKQKLMRTHLALLPVYNTTKLHHFFRLSNFVYFIIMYVLVITGKQETE